MFPRVLWAALAGCSNPRGRGLDLQSLLAGSGLALGVWNGGAVLRTEPFTWGVWCCLQADNGRPELGRRTLGDVTENGFVGENPTHGWWVHVKCSVWVVRMTPGWKTGYVSPYTLAHSAPIPNHLFSGLGLKRWSSLFPSFLCTWVACGPHTWAPWDPRRNLLAAYLLWRNVDANPLPTFNWAMCLFIVEL